jgi:endonuclease YncB( thermonuclease family)
MRIFCLLLLAAMTATAAGASELRSVPQIVDADTVYVGGQKIRLSGIDAPEMDQNCLDNQGRDDSCGVTAKVRLEAFSHNREWQCSVNGNDLYGRSLGVCRVDGVDVNRWLVRSGWALAFTRYSKLYVEDEKHARDQKLGLWAGSFTAPWDWRRRSRKTSILGATAVPINAQSRLIAPQSAPPSSGCVIKGNLKNRNECIYHMPGQRYYGRLNMSSSASRRWFCSEAEAVAAGCRKSKR